MVAEKVENEDEESYLLVAAALSQMDEGVALLVQAVGVALLCFAWKGGICVSAVFASRVLSCFSESDASLPSRNMRGESLSWLLPTVPCVFSTK